MSKAATVNIRSHGCLYVDHLYCWTYREWRCDASVPISYKTQWSLQMVFFGPGTQELGAKESDRRVNVGQSGGQKHNWGLTSLCACWIFNWGTISALLCSLLLSALPPTRHLKRFNCGVNEAGKETAFAFVEREKTVKFHSYNTHYSAWYTVELFGHPIWILLIWRIAPQFSVLKYNHKLPHSKMCRSSSLCLNVWPSFVCFCVRHLVHLFAYLYNLEF